MLFYGRMQAIVLVTAAGTKRTKGTIIAFLRLLYQKPFYDSELFLFAESPMWCTFFPMLSLPSLLFCNKNESRHFSVSTFILQVQKSNRP